MLRNMRGYGLGMVLLLSVAITVFAENPTESDFYPLKWAEIDAKSIIDNSRLFKKYKDCFMADNVKGCPREVIEAKKRIPELIDTSCAKCLPEHIKKAKETYEYLCEKKKPDLETLKKHFDPDDVLIKRFEEKYGKLNCDI